MKRLTDDDFQKAKRKMEKIVMRLIGQSPDKVNALIHYAHEIGVSPTVLRDMITENLRPKAVRAYFEKLSKNLEE